MRSFPNCFSSGVGGTGRNYDNITSGLLVAIALGSAVLVLWILTLWKLIDWAISIVV